MTLLASLPQSYENLIVSLESRADNLSAEFVRARLLQEEARRRENSTKEEDSALMARKYKRGGLDRQPRCYNCNEIGHIRYTCPKPAKKNEETAQVEAKLTTEEEITAFSAAALTSKDIWYVDSGASNHLCSRKDWFATFKSIPPQDIHLADNRVIVATGVGSVQVKLKVNAREEDGVFQEVLYVPGLRGNLLSVDKISAQNFQVNFNSRGCVIRNQSGRTVAVATRESGCYRLAARVQMRRRQQSQTETIVVELGGPAVQVKANTQSSGSSAVADDNISIGSKDGAAADTTTGTVNDDTAASTEQQPEHHSADEEQTGGDSGKEIRQSSRERKQPARYINEQQQKQKKKSSQVQHVTDKIRGIAQSSPGRKAVSNLSSKVLSSQNRNISNSFSLLRDDDDDDEDDDEEGDDK
jgi:hypothetical protein